MRTKTGVEDKKKTFFVFVKIIVSVQRMRNVQKYKENKRKTNKKNNNKRKWSIFKLLKLTQISNILFHLKRSVGSTNSFVRIDCVFHSESNKTIQFYYSIYLLTHHQNNRRHRNCCKEMIFKKKNLFFLLFNNFIT